MCLPLILQMLWDGGRVCLYSPKYLTFHHTMFVCKLLAMLKCPFPLPPHPY